LALGVLASGARGAAISQGVWRMGVDVLWTRGLTGAGQTVAILDLGFGGLDDSIAAGELPPRDQLQVRSFDATYGFDGRDVLGNPVQHGVRMAEIVHDIAPQAQLALVNYHTEDEFEQAVAWLVANRVPIVNHSNSFLTPPHDGTGRTARIVDAAAAAGVLWVNSAGNYAERHWAGRADATGTILPLQTRAGDQLSFTLNWRGAPDARASVSVQRQGADGVWADAAPGFPAGTASEVTPKLIADASPYRVLVQQVAGAPADLDLFSRSVGFGANAVPDGSIPTPGDAAGSLTVAAVPWTGTTLASYSSRGPTDDGRLKPDISAPTYITSNPAWPGTAGTSAATPHVAAAAALLRQERQAAGLPVDPASLRQALLANALDLGPPGPDPLYGAGMLRLDTTPPRVQVLIGTGSRPLVRVRVTDDGTVSGIRATLGGTQVARARTAWTRFRLPRLTAARRRLVVTADDMAGNAGTAARWVRAPAR
jgi:hypothetical protein